MKTITILLMTAMVLMMCGSSRFAMSQEWYTNDLMVYNGYTPDQIYRQLDLKQGDDGWMYLLINTVNGTFQQKSFRVYKSGNGGGTWTLVYDYVHPVGWFIQSTAMLVESRNNAIPDSTRILVYFTSSSAGNGNDAGLYCASFRRDGSALYTTTCGTPTAGNRFVQVTACSDGAYEDVSTATHAMVREESNSGSYISLRHFRSTNFGQNHTNSTLSTFLDETWPSAGFSRENSGTDTIYIAVERVISASEHEIRVIATSENPNGVFYEHYLTNATSGIIYSRPCLTIVQDLSNTSRKIFITSTRNNVAKCHFSTNSGGSWNEQNLFFNDVVLRDYTWCSSNPYTSGSGGYIVALAVNQSGSAISVGRGTVDAFGSNLVNTRNSHPCYSTLTPVCAIYREGNNLYSVFSYAGVGFYPTPVYYNAEHLLTGIEPVGNEIPDGFELSQNYPNPFNPSTTIEFALPVNSVVELKVFDISGREVTTLLNSENKAGYHQIKFDGSNFSSGMYFYRIKTPKFTETKKMILVK